MTYKKCKRILDIIFSIIGLIMLLPLFIIIAFLIKIDSRGPVFFRQERIGINKRVFIIYKFRTMTTEAPKDCPPYQFEHPENYITKFGDFLRKSSLDETPQLFNILKGEMSFIGPRPSSLLEKELQCFRDEHNVHSVFPGLTGLAQINGRDKITMQNKIKFDSLYVEKISLLFDARIFVVTVLKVLKKDDIHEGKHHKER